MLRRLPLLERRPYRVSASPSWRPCYLSSKPSTIACKAGQTAMRTRYPQALATSDSPLPWTPSETLSVLPKMVSLLPTASAY